MHRRIHPVLAGIALLALAVSACSSDAVEADAAATVNGEEISNELFQQVSEAAIDAASGGPSAGPSAAPSAAAPSTPDEAAQLQTRRDILGQMIQGEIITQFAAEQGDYELDQEAIDQIIEDGGEQLQTQAAAAGLEPDTYAEVYIGPQYLLNEVARGIAQDIEVTDQQVQDRLDQMSQSGEGVTATLSHILVESEEAANQALEWVEGGESFADVAADVSTDTSAQQGGALGEDVPLTQFVPEFATAAASAPIGEPTGPVQTQFGFHIILVEDRTEPDLGDMEEDLRDQIALDSEEGQAALQPVVQELQTAYDEAEVEVASRYGAWDPSAGQNGNGAVVPEDQVGDSSAPPTGGPPAGGPPTGGPPTDAPVTEAPVPSTTPQSSPTS